MSCLNRSLLGAGTTLFVGLKRESQDGDAAARYRTAHLALHVLRPSIGHSLSLGNHITISHSMGKWSNGCLVKLIGVLVDGRSEEVDRSPGREK